MNFKYITLSLALATSALLSSCLDSGDETILVEGAEVEITGPQAVIAKTGESALISGEGYNVFIPSTAVPLTRDGKNGKVAMSISALEQLPSGLPTGVVIQQGTCVNIEPMNFVFNTPVHITMPVPRPIDGNGGYLTAYHYNDYYSRWEEVPVSAINGNGRIELSTLEVGMFVLGYKSDDNIKGGIRIPKQYLDPNYTYHMTLMTAGGAHKRIASVNGDNDLCMTDVPFGEAKVMLSRESRIDRNIPGTGTLESLKPFTVDVDQPLLPSYGFNLSVYNGWTNVSVPTSDWSSTRPTEWTEATKPYGTGVFQATLTWVNNEDAAADYDLHLYGPNGIHVFFSRKSDGGYELDRDWLKAKGNAVENIYSVDESLPRGEYIVKVNLYSESSGNNRKRYNCRIIRDGYVVKSVSGAIANVGSFDEIYRFTIQ